MRKWLPLVIVLVAVLALSACGGSSEPPAADTSTDTATVEDARLPGGLMVGDKYPKAMEWVSERLDICKPRDDGTFRGPDFVWECMDDGAADTCEDWLGTTIDSNNAWYEECIEDMRYFISEVLADKGVEGDALRVYRQEVETELPSGVTLRYYATTVFDPEPMEWVRKQRKTCAASRVILSIENCMNEGAIHVCAEWFGGIDLGNSKYLDCVPDMQYLAEKVRG